MWLDARGSVDIIHQQIYEWLDEERIGPSAWTVRSWILLPPGNDYGIWSLPLSSLSGVG